jgi:hypothetical protein
VRADQQGTIHTCFPSTGGMEIEIVLPARASAALPSGQP